MDDSNNTQPSRLRPSSRLAPPAAPVIKPLETTPNLADTWEDVQRRNSAMREALNVHQVRREAIEEAFAELVELFESLPTPEPANQPKQPSTLSKAQPVRPMTEEEKRIVDMHGSGMSASEIARRLAGAIVRPDQVRRTLCRLRRQYGVDVVPHGKRGRPKSEF